MLQRRAGRHPLARGWLVLLLILPVLATCDGDSLPGAWDRAAGVRGYGHGAKERPLGGTAIAQVIRRTHFAFRPDGGLLVGEQEAYSALVDPAGRVAFSPMLGHRAGGETVFQTASIRRSGADLAAGTPSVGLDDTGYVVVERGRTVETLENTEAGVHQSWHFEEFPDGGGDLLVRVAVDGQPFAGETGGGLHFRDPGSPVGIRYSHATWVDAAGVATDIPCRWDGSAIVMRVRQETLESSAYPAILDPTIGGEIMMDDPIFGSAPGDQIRPAMSYGDGKWLVVWDDHRATDHDIYGARVDPSGLVYDLVGIPICEAADDQEEPAVAYDGTNWLVVWQDRRDGSTYDLFAQLVDADGNMSGSEFAVSTAADDQAYPAVSFAASEYLVVWQDYRNSPSNEFDVYGQLVNPDGSLDGSGLAISTALGDEIHPDVAYDGSRWLVVWEDWKDGSGDIYGLRINPDGSFEGLVFAVCTVVRDQQHPSIAAGGGRWFVVWDDLRNTTTTGYDIYGQIVNDDGSLESGSFFVSTANDIQRRPHVSFGSSNFLVVWEDYRNRTTTGFDVYGQIVTPSGDLIGGNQALNADPENQGRPTASFGSTGWLVTWEDSDILGQLVDAAGTPDGLDFIVSSRVPPNSQINADVAFDGTNYLVVWQDNVSGDWDIYGIRVDADGDPIDLTGILLFAAENDQINPAVAFNGTDWHVVWEDWRGGGDNYDVYGQLVDSDGNLVGSDHNVSIAAGSQCHPAIACDGTNCLVAWDDDRDGDRDLYGQFVDDAGGKVGTEFSISTATDDQDLPAAVFDGTRYLIAWEDHRDGDSNVDIYAKQVDTAGSAVGGDIAISTEAGNQLAPSAAHGFSTYLISWHDTNGISAQRVGEDRSLQGSNFAVSAAVGTHTDSDVTFDGINFVLAWVRDQGGDVDIYGNKVTIDGDVLDPDGIALSAKSTDQSAPALGTGLDGDDLLVYNRADLFASQGSERVFGVIVNFWDCYDIDGDGYGAPGDLSCSGGPETDCDDNDPDINPGAAEVCDGVDNNCIDGVDEEPLATASCDDGLWCNGEETCGSGSCMADTDECPENGDVCDGVTSCDEDNDQCVTTAPLDCDDGNPCTDDSCDPVAGCQHVNNTDPCDDGDFCNGADTCSAGSCSVHDGDPCVDDGLWCNGTESCDEDLDQCVHSNDTCVDDGIFCNGTETCDEDTDVCEHSGDPCPDDGLFCNGTESCDEDGDQCLTTGDPCPDDGTYCNGTESCNEDGDVCEHSGDPCPDDGLWCNGTESCVEVIAQCVHSHTPQTRCPDDGLWCNGTESCNETADECRHSGDRCSDDGLFCTGVESCDEDADQCIATGDPCGDDGVFCNGTESCDEDGDACVHTGDPCTDDGLWCNGDEFCDESNDLCKHESTPALTCPDDGLWCNGTESCNEGADACVHSSTPTLTCPDDGLWCNGAESCDEDEDECVSETTPENKCPDDEVFCNGAESCDETADACVHGGDPCPDDGYWCNGGEFCDETNDQCLHTSSPAQTCPDDGLWCTGEERCDEKNDVCVSDHPDGDRCPNDLLWCNGVESCDEENDECAHEYAEGERCPDDGLWCNGDEICDEDEDECTSAYAEEDRCADDGQWCNGEETCDEKLDLCAHTGNTCGADEICDEKADRCAAADDEEKDDASDEEPGCGA